MERRLGASTERFVRGGENRSQAGDIELLEPCVSKKRNRMGNGRKCDHFVIYASGIGC